MAARRIDSRRHDGCIYLRVRRPQRGVPVATGVATPAGVRGDLHGQGALAPRIVRDRLVLLVRHWRSLVRLNRKTLEPLAMTAEAVGVLSVVDVVASTAHLPGELL